MIGDQRRLPQWQCQSDVQLNRDAKPWAIARFFRFLRFFVFALAPAVLVSVEPWFGY